MNILVDFHHADLWWSLQLLANRLGATLYRPYGMEWYDQGYFKLYGDLRRKDPERWIAKQYLVDTLFSYADNYKIGRETYNGCKDYPLFNTLTLEQAKDAQIDVVICSVHENEPYFAKLKEFYSNAKFIRQVGNDLDTLIDESLYPNLLSSATQPYDAFKGQNKVLYRQEFPLDLFQPTPPINFNNIYSFQNDIEQFEDTWTFWTDLKHKLRDYNFKSYGVGCEQGKIYPKREYIQRMLEATFIVQSKGPWEGYGHCIHNTMRLGRPMILKFSDYQGKMAESLLIKDETYLEMTDPDIVEKIRHFSESERFKKMSDKCQNVFGLNVSFNWEFTDKIKPFFNNLV
jgi:hypothetical protein